MVAEPEPETVDSRAAGLGRLARVVLEPLDLHTMLQRASAIIAEVLAVDFCKVLELQPDRKTLLLRAAAGWPDELIGRASIPAGNETHVGRALLTNTPVVLEDLSSEVTIWPTSSLLQHHGVTSGVSVVIPGAEPFGVLAVHSRARRSFPEAELQFLGEACDLLGRAIGRRRIDQAVHESEERFRRTFHDSPIGLLMTDLTRRIIQANSAACELFGYSVEELAARALDDLLSPADRPTGQLDRLCSGELTRFRRDLRAQTKAGRTVWVDLTVTLVAGDARMPLHTVVMIEDISAGRDLRLTRLAVAHAREPILWAGADGRLREANTSAVRALGYTRGELLTLTLADLDEQLQPAEWPQFWRTLSRRKFTRRRTRLCPKAGDRIPVELSVNYFRVDGDAYACAFARDIRPFEAAASELKASEERYRALAGRLLNFEEEQHRSVARELHDNVNQRLARLSFDLAHLEAACPPDLPARVKRQLRSIEQDVVGMSDDIRGLAHRLHPAVVEAVGLPAALRELCAATTRTLGIPARFIGRRPPSAISGEVALCLYRVAQECLRNVAKHAESDAISVVLTRSPLGVRLSIKDTGVGFDPAVPPPERGLGLVSIQERVRMVGGTLTIASRPGRGTRVTVDVPVGAAT